MKKIIIILLSLFININANKDMVILIDDYETFENISKNSLLFLEAIGIKYLSALDQESFPILVTKSLFSTIVKVKYFFQDVLNLNLDSLHAKYNNLVKFKDIDFLRFFKEASISVYNLYNYLNNQIIINNLNKNNEKLILDIIKHRSDLTNNILIKLKNYFKSDEQISFFLTDILNYIICYSVIYQNWIIKDVNKDFCLLIPKKYLNSLKIDYSSVKYNKNLNNRLSNTELKLGLKVNHLKDLFLAEKTILKYSDFNQKSFLEALNKIFVKRKENENGWTFYCSGHGFSRYHETLSQIKKLKNYYIENKFNLKNIDNKINYLNNYYAYNKNFEDKIIGLSKEFFRDFLIFLNNKIDTNFLYYSTCFSGGNNLIEPYKNLILNYDIVSEGLSEAYTCQNSLYLNIPYFFCSEKKGFSCIDFNKKRLKLDTSLNFKKFFKKIRSGIKNLKDSIYYINDYFEFKNNSYYLKTINNMPSIRYKYKDKFKLIIGFDNVKIIDHSDKKDIDLNNKNLALLYTEYIDKNLILSKDVKAIISMTKENGHIFENIKALDLSLAEVINRFLFTKELAYPKIFWIKNLKCKDFKSIKNLIITNNILTSDKVENFKDFQVLNCNSVYFQDSLNKYNLVLPKDLDYADKNLNLDIKKIDFDYKKEILNREPRLKIYLKNNFI